MSEITRVCRIKDCGRCQSQEKIIKINFKRPQLSIWVDRGDNYCIYINECKIEGLSVHNNNLCENIRIELQKINIDLNKINKDNLDIDSIDLIYEQSKEDIKILNIIMSCFKINFKLIVNDDISTK
ncbi:MAG: hypothetical protein ACYCUW_06950 [bacterium]